MGGEAERARRLHRWWLAGVFAVALGLRLAHILAVSDFEREHLVRGMDRWLDVTIARAVAHGDVLGGRYARYESAPAYALLLGAAYRTCGRCWRGPLLLQAVLGAVAPLLLYGAGRRLASERVGLLSAALAAVYGPAIFHEGLTVKFALVPVTVSAALWAASAAGRGGLGAAFAAGAATSLLVAVRANAVAVLIVVVAWIVATVRPARAATCLLAFMLGVTTVAGPLALRRMLAAERGDAASLWGIHFYIGAQPDGDGGYVVVPGVADNVFGHVDDAREIAERATGHRLGPAEVSRFWFRRGLDGIRERPWDYVALEGRKLRRILIPWEDDAFGDDYAEYAARSPVLRWGSIGFGDVAVVALLGLALVLRRPSRATWCAVFVVAYAGSLALFFVTSRYRLPLVPPLLVCAAIALGRLADLAARRRALVLPIMGGPVLATVLVYGADPGTVARSALVIGTGLPVAAWLRGRLAPPSGLDQRVT